MSMPDDERDELRRKFEQYAESRDPGLRDHLVTAHLGLAEYLARRFANRGEPLDDLIQVASVGLLKAVDRFDPDRGLEFSTYATPTIGEIAERAGASEEEVLEAMEAGRAYRFASLDAPGAAGDDDNQSLVSQLGKDDPLLTGIEHRVALSPLIAELPRREQVILHLRFFEGLTQSEIAGRLGISQMHVSRLLARSLAKLRGSADEA